MGGSHFNSTFRVVAGIAGSEALGTLALILQDQGFKTPTDQVKQDLGFLEYSVSTLE